MPFAPVRDLMHRRLRTSHSLTVMSYEAVASTLQSVLLNLLSNIVSAWPPSVFQTCRFCPTSYTITAPSEKVHGARFSPGKNEID